MEAGGIKRDLLEWTEQRENMKHKTDAEYIASLKVKITKSKSTGIIFSICTILSLIAIFKTSEVVKMTAEFIDEGSVFVGAMFGFIIGVFSVTAIILARYTSQSFLGNRTESLLIHYSDQLTKTKSNKPVEATK
jgi:hypothetical protein